MGKAAVVPGKIDTAEFDNGGNGRASCKQKHRGGTFPVGQDKLFSRRKLDLREYRKWADFTFKAEKSGRYDRRNRTFFNSFPDRLYFSVIMLY